MPPSLAAASSALVGSLLAALLLNIRHAWLIIIARRGQQTAPEYREPKSPPTLQMQHRPSWFSVSGHTASWFAPAEGPRVVRVSSVRSQDVGLFHQLGLAVQVVEQAATSRIDSDGMQLHIRGSKSIEDASDLLLLPWRLPVPARSTPSMSEITNVSTQRQHLDLENTILADVLWGQWTSNLQFFDGRLRAGQLINSMMGLEHDTMGTPHALARSHQRCVRLYGVRSCNFTSAQLVLHSHRDVSRLEALFGEDELADLSAWHEVAADGIRSVWFAKQATYQRSLVHHRASMFDGRRLIASHDMLPAGLWVIQPWPTSPMLWRHHRFFLRTWLVVPSVLPLRVYLLQDAWAHVVAKPYRPDQLMSNYKDRCVHLWSIKSCSVTHAHRVMRSNHELFPQGLIGVPRSVTAARAGVAEPASFWRRRVWPALENAATRLITSSWRQLAMYEKALRSTASVPPYRRVALLTLDWVIDEGGKPVLFDVDVDGAAATNGMPLSHQYARNAIELLGVNGYNRTLYGQRMQVKVATFCKRRAMAGKARCGSQGRAALMDLVDESHHTGAFARIFPPSGAQGCGAFCEFFESTSSNEVNDEAFNFTEIGSEWDRLTWAFLREHPQFMPARVRPPLHKSDKSTTTKS